MTAWGWGRGGQSCTIRAQYRQDWKSKEMRIRQRAVAMYFIDKVGGGDRRGVG